MNTHWFLSLEDAYEKVNAWVEEYNYFRPHSSLDDKTPAEFIEMCQQQEAEHRCLPTASDEKEMFSSAVE